MRSYKNVAVTGMAVLLSAVLCLGSGLSDPPLLGDGGSVLSLDGEGWLISANGTGVPLLSGIVPGDLVSDLEREGFVGDPIFGTNWRDESEVYSYVNWTYSRFFDVAVGSALETASSVLLVFDGL